MNKADRDPTCAEALASIVFGHRRWGATMNSAGLHDIFRLSTGEAMGRMTSHEAWEFYHRQLAAGATAP